MADDSSAFALVLSLTQILKGISLSVEQFNTLLRIMPSIAAAAAKEGAIIEGFEPAATDNGEEESEPVTRRVKPKPKPEKANIEATSDEDEEHGD